MTEGEFTFWYWCVVVSVFIIEMSAFLYIAVLEDIFTSLRRKKEKRYEKIFADWVKEGNLLFKAKGRVFIYCEEFSFPFAERFLVFDNEGDCYEYGFYKHIIGKAISKNRLSEEPIYKRCLTKDEFVEMLIDADSENKLHGSIQYPFSFDKIDLNKLPDWLIAELMERKLSE